MREVKGVQKFHKMLRFGKPCQFFMLDNPRDIPALNEQLGMGEYFITGHIDARPFER